MSKEFPKIVFLSKKKGIGGFLLRFFIAIFALGLLFFLGIGIYFLKEKPELPKLLAVKNKSIEKQNHYLANSIENLKPSITAVDTSYKKYKKLLYLPKKAEKSKTQNSTGIDSLSIRGLVGYSNALFDFFDDIAKNASTTKGVWKNIPLVFPFDDNAKLVITRPFSNDLTDPFTGIKKTHNGIDIAAENETKILAPADGDVVSVAQNDIFWGKTIKISHQNGYQTIYAHLGTISVRQGQKVRRSEEIGTIGKSGWTTNPHLHYELIKNGVYLDPQLYNFISLYD